MNIPETALANTRKAINELVKLVEGDESDNAEAFEEKLQDATFLVWNAFSALDTSLSKGAPLPSDWERAGRPTRQEVIRDLMRTQEQLTKRGIRVSDQAWWMASELLPELGYRDKP